MERRAPVRIEQEARAEYFKTRADKLFDIITDLRAELRTLREDKARLDWLEQNYNDLSYAGVEAQRIPGGSISKDYWQVDEGSIVHPHGGIERLVTQAVGLRAAIDQARSTDGDDG